MFEYNLNPNTNELYVDLPEELHFRFSYLYEMATFAHKALNCDCSKVYVSCKEKSDYDKICKAYLYNVLQHIAKKKEAKWNSELKSIITSNIHSEDGRKFSDVDFGNVITTEHMNFYRFTGKIGVQKPIDEMTKILVDKNLSINSNELREFLSTTIGEIFANSIMHSEQDELFFMYDIMFDDDEFFLCINIIDYGTTIIDNVKRHFRTQKKENIKSRYALNWAIQSGNTTKNSSGVEHRA